MGLNGITYTTADGETINLDSDYISEQESKEIVDLRNQEIKDKTFRRHIVQKKYSEDKKNGKVIKWSKQRIWRENVLSAFKSTDDEVKINALEEAMIYVIYKYLKDNDFRNIDVIALLLKEFATIKDDDSEDEIKQKIINKDLIEKSTIPRFSGVYYALGSKGCSEIYNDKKKLDEFIKSEDPLIIRYKVKLKVYYKCLPKFFDYSLDKLFHIYRTYKTEFGRLKRNGTKARDININVRTKRVNVAVKNDDLVVKKVDNMDFRIERQDDPKAFYCGPAPVPEKAKSRDVIKNEISEKARITYYIIDKIFADPKPGTTMTINNDASIEFKF